MKSPARLPLVLAIACSLGAGALVHAQSLTATLSETPAAYQDRLIDGGNLKPDVDLGDEGSASPDGLPRSFEVEAGLGSTRTENAFSREEGLKIGAFWETTNWGAFSFDGVLRHGSGTHAAGAVGTDASATLWQRGLPVEGGWLVDNGLGVLNGPLIPLARNQYRFILPTAPFVGAQTQWRGNGWDIVGSAGEPGLFDGGHWSGFHATGGTALSAGAQTVLSPAWTLGAMVLSERDALPAFVGADGVVRDDTAAYGRTSGTSLFASAAWSAAPWGTSLQASLLASQTDSSGGLAPLTMPSGTAQGVWLDATTPAGVGVHHYGLFHLDPGLSWGINPMPNDLEGGYYRFDYQRGRWAWSGGLDTVRSVDGQGIDGTYATGGGRYQWTSTFGLGASATVRTGSSTAETLSVYADKKTSWGTSRVQFDGARDPSGQDGSRLTFDQAFPFEGATHLSTAVSYETTSDITYPGTTRRATLSVYGGRDFGRWSVDANVRAVRGQGPNAENGLDGTLGLNWRLASEWTLTGSFYKSQGTQRSAFVLDPLVNPTVPVQDVRDTVWFVSVRYSRHAGTPAAVLGGPRTNGVGAIEGSVYLDDNNDGARNAGEAAAQHITLVLDGRYSVSTDEQGRFAFPNVAAGAHTLTVVSDNLPLPWALTPAQTQRSLVVPVRGVATVDVGARRRGSPGSGF